MNQWTKLADSKSIKKTIAALKENGIEAVVVNTGEEAKQKVLELIPKGSEVMTVSSVTLQEIGVDSEINESGRFHSLRNKIYSMDYKTQRQEMSRLGAAPDFVVGSVHAVTQDGHVLIASASGSQLPAYVYGAGSVIWVVGAQKIVKDTSEGIKRIYEYVLPLEDERARKAYGVGSGVHKLLILNQEKTVGRITLILVKEKLGF